jgi:hypothetical protein
MCNDIENVVDPFYRMQLAAIPLLDPEHVRQEKVSGDIFHRKVCLFFVDLIYLSVNRETACPAEAFQG